ncbi:MAG: hypothetical protein AMXMBFR53_40060 [Gemmatimonadota bacterium]
MEGSGPLRVVALLALAVMAAAPRAAAAQVHPGGHVAQGVWSDADWAVLERKARWALEAGLDSVPMGDAVAALGRTFVGTPYVPHTLESGGPEGLVVNFRGLDCVTFVENVLTLARFVREPDARALLERRREAERRYETLLAGARYRGGVLSGYPSRLHYFSDWVGDAQAKGLVRDVTRELGGTLDLEAVDFMSTHPEAYPQLREDPRNLVEIRAAEARLSETGRWYLPEASLERVAPSIRDGDIIAATSTVKGLDVAHTGLALWVGGSLRLMHAPLVGDSVQISEEPLAARILRIPGQDGVIVARPCDARGGGGC